MAGLSPFSDIRTVSVPDSGGGRGMFLVLVRDGVAAIARLSRERVQSISTGEASDVAAGRLIARLRAASEEQRIAFHRLVDESEDPYELLGRLASAQPEFGHHDRGLSSATASVPLLSTGFRDLDEATGAFGAGELWLVTGEHGQGRSSLLTQWAARLVQDAALRVWLVAPRDDAATVAARLTANQGKVSLSHLHPGHALSADERATAARVTGSLRAAGLDVYARGRCVEPSDVVRSFRQDGAPDALVVDDVDLSGWPPDTLRMFADAGVLVIVAATGDVTSPRTDEMNSWVRTADRVLTVQTYALDPTDLVEGGVAKVRLVRNRLGPVCECKVFFDGFYARFRDQSSPILMSRAAPAPAQQQVAQPGLGRLSEHE